jgi:hypothetical protein
MKKTANFQSFLHSGIANRDLFGFRSFRFCIQCPSYLPPDFVVRIYVCMCVHAHCLPVKALSSQRAENL